jgi:hypothetical protein
MEAEASPAGSSVEEGTSSLVAQSLDQSGGSTADNPEPASAATDAQTIIPVVVRVEEDNPTTDQPGTTGEVSATEDATSEEPVAAPEPSGPRFSEEEWADLSRGLLLVELSSHQGD